MVSRALPTPDFLTANVLCPSALDQRRFPASTSPLETAAQISAHSYFSDERLAGWHACRAQGRNPMRHPDLPDEIDLRPRPSLSEPSGSPA